MESWDSVKSRITASVRTTNRMNALLSESLFTRRRNAFRSIDTETDAETEKQIPKKEIQFFHKNFCMERVFNIIKVVIDERMAWDRFSRAYDTGRALQLAEALATEIRKRTKSLNLNRYRIVCIVTIVEKRNQGVCYAMRHYMDEKLDNFTKYVFQRPTYYIIVTAYLVYKN